MRAYTDQLNKKLYSFGLLIIVLAGLDEVDAKWLVSTVAVANLSWLADALPVSLSRTKLRGVRSQTDGAKSETGCGEEERGTT